MNIIEKVKVKFMSNSNRFAVGIHVLAVIGLNDEKENSSKFIAQSVNTNPVVIRRIMGMLKKNGLIHVQPGIAGAKLAKDLKDITLLDVYKAVFDEKEMKLFPIHENPNPECIVGRNIENTVRSIFSLAQSTLFKVLEQITMEDVVNGIIEEENSLKQ